MDEKVSPLMLELLRWIAGHPRTYGETMEAWRTTCPRSSVWEDAWMGGLVQNRSQRRRMEESEGDTNRPGKKDAGPEFIRIVVPWQKWSGIRPCCFW